jgi:hypothetical protein
LHSASTSSPNAIKSTTKLCAPSCPTSSNNKSSNHSGYSSLEDDSSMLSFKPRKASSPSTPSPPSTATSPWIKMSTSKISISSNPSNSLMINSSKKPKCSPSNYKNASQPSIKKSPWSSKISKNSAQLKTLTKRNNESKSNSPTQWMFPKKPPPSTHSSTQTTTTASKRNSTIF